MNRLPTLLAKTLTLMALSVFVANVFIAHAQEVANLDEITQSAVGLTAIPPRLGDDDTLVAKPGETVQIQVRVRNSSAVAKTVSTTLEDFTIGDDGKTPVPVNSSVDSRWSLARWMELRTSSVVVPPGASQTIPIVIQVPANARPGGRYVMVMHQPTEADSAEVVGEIGGKAAVTQRVGTLVYLRVAGDVTEQANLRNISVPPFMEFGPVPIKFEVENLSDIHIRPQTEIKITNLFGREVERIHVPTQNIFPYTQRQFAVEWDRVWGFGRYTAHFMTSYGNGGKTVSAQVHFWVVPLTLLLAIAIALMSLLAIGIAVRRHLRHRNREDQQHMELLEERIRQLEDELEHHDLS